MVVNELLAKEFSSASLKGVAQSECLLINQSPDLHESLLFVVSFMVEAPIVFSLGAFANWVHEEMSSRFSCHVNKQKCIRGIIRRAFASYVGTIYLIFVYVSIEIVVRVEVW